MAPSFPPTTKALQSGAHGTADAIPSASSLEPRASRLMLRRLGLADYLPTWEAMKTFTRTRTAETADELWLLQHPPVYTYGVAGRREHLPPATTEIPVVKIDRGGQVTYHGPGQLVLYTLLDLHRLNLSVRELVRRLEQAVLDLLADFRIEAVRRDGAPGVYVDGAKIAALGLRVSRGCSYHGLSLNVDLELEPFRNIDPCGYPGMPVTRMADLGVDAGVERIGEGLVHKVVEQLSKRA